LFGVLLGIGVFIGKSFDLGGYAVRDNAMVFGVGCWQVAIREGKE
jgi:hypothetical protein